jgi:hypothetical protein
MGDVCVAQTGRRLERHASKMETVVVLSKERARFIALQTTFIEIAKPSTPPSIISGAISIWSAKILPPPNGWLAASARDMRSGAALCFAQDCGAQAET